VVDLDSSGEDERTYQFNKSQRAGEISEWYVEKRSESD
jgi:hypothetical protein